MDSTENTEIRFPALVFNDGWFGAIASVDEISKPSRLAVKEGYYKHLFLVDSNSNKFRVVSAEKIRTLYELNFRTMLELLGANPQWLMKLSFGPPSHVKLDEVKSLLLKSFQKHTAFWDEMCDFEEFSELIKRAQSLDAIFQTLRDYHQLSS